MKLAIAEAIEKHRKLGQLISIWQDGKGRYHAPGGATEI